MNAILHAIQHIRRMHGGSQAHLLRASDGNLYVVKFQNSPQGIRVLANELFATQLAHFLGLPMAEICIIEVPETLIEETPELRIEVAGSFQRCAAGLQVGSRFVAAVQWDRTCEYLPKRILQRVANRIDFARVLAFDKWVGNCDSRQAVFTKRQADTAYHATFIDQGCCFNAQAWDFPDLPLLGTFSNVRIYHDVAGWESFEPVLSNIESIDYSDLWRCAAKIPHEWFEHDGEGLFTLIETLHRRRTITRDLITKFRNSSSDPFPRWRGWQATNLALTETDPLNASHPPAG